jgi:hypothetical protein
MFKKLSEFYGNGRCEEFKEHRNTINGKYTKQMVIVSKIEAL